jgi:hypothetical protein
MIETEDKISQLEQLLAEIKKYFHLRMDALKLRAADNLSTLFSLLLSTLICIFLLTIAFLFLLGAFTYWLSLAIGSPAGAMLITGGFVLLLTAILLLLRKKIITNRMVRLFIRLLFAAPYRERKHTEEENDYE